MSSDSIKLQAYVVPLALLAAATRISIDLIPKLTGMNPIFYYLSFILCFFLEILFIVYVTKSFKEKNNNQLTFQEGLKVGIIMETSGCKLFVFIGTKMGKVAFFS